MKNKRVIKAVVAAVAAVAVVVSTFLIKNVIEREVLYPVRYEDLVVKYSEQYSVDEALIYAIINCESGFDPNAVSAAGAIGLMQITPETFQWLQTKDDIEETLPEGDLYDPETNIKYGALLISLNVEEFGNVRTAIASYNAGRGKVAEWLADERYSADSRTLMAIPYKETEDYVEKVIRNYQIYKERLGR